MRSDPGLELGVLVSCFFLRTEGYLSNTIVSCDRRMVELMVLSAANTRTVTHELKSVSG